MPCADGWIEALDRMVTGQVPKERELLRKVMARFDPSVPLDVPVGHQA
ncbi:MAG TPA: hypothetical protein VE889_00645 [Actinomycetota bacterium]|nr:hypothetical protein [Actinomycetota bacterium]